MPILIDKKLGKITKQPKAERNSGECFFEKESIYPLDGNGKVLITIISLLAQKEVSVMRLIYRLFLEGKAKASICGYLEGLGIPSPGGKETWSKTTVASILTNEKYKGDALLKKKFTVDFLEKKMKPNEDEVP